MAFDARRVITLPFVQQMASGLIVLAQLACSRECLSPRSVRLRTMTESLRSTGLSIGASNSSQVTKFLVLRHLKANA